MSSFLLILMFFNQNILSFYLADYWQRKNYLQNDLALLDMSTKQSMAQCEKLSLENNDKVYRLVFKNPEKNDRTLHFSWCERVYLFKAYPTTAANEKRFSTLIDVIAIPKFIQRMNDLNSQSIPLYWFSNSFTEWEVNENIRGIIVSEGELHIRGKGEIRGAVITKGKLKLDEKIKLIYNKLVVNEVVRAYSFWRLAEKSWYDFESL